MFCSQNGRCFTDISAIIRKLLVHINHIFLALGLGANTVSLHTTSTRKETYLHVQ